MNTYWGKGGVSLVVLSQSQSKPFFLVFSLNRAHATAQDLFQQTSDHTEPSSIITQTQTRIIIMGRGRNTVIGSLTSLAVIGASGYCVWRFALGSPTTVEEAEQGAKDLWEKAKNFDFDDFTQVLEDGLEGLDFGSFFDSDPR